MTVTSSRWSNRCAIKGITAARSMASSVCEPEPAFARIRRQRICLSQEGLIARLPANSELDLNQAAGVSSVRGIGLGKVSTTLATRSVKGNLPQASSGLRGEGEQASSCARKPRELLIPRPNAEAATTNNKQRTRERETEILV